MKVLTLDVKGLDVVIAGIKDLADEFPKAAKASLKRIAIEVHRESTDFLNGPASPAGAYPIPVKTGHLKRSLDFLPPGKSKTVGGLTFRAGPLESKVYNSAQYSRTIHEGLDSSKKYGERPFLVDGFEEADKAGKINKILDEETDKALEEL